MSKIKAKSLTIDTMATLHIKRSVLKLLVGFVGSTAFAALGVLLIQGYAVSLSELHALSGEYARDHNPDIEIALGI